MLTLLIKFAPILNFAEDILVAIVEFKYFVPDPDLEKKSPVKDNLYFVFINILSLSFSATYIENKLLCTECLEKKVSLLWGNFLFCL